MDMAKHERYTGTPTLEPLLRVIDVSRTIQRSRTTVYELVRSGELHPFRMGARLRFTADDVRDYIERQRTEVAP
jgi:excisionase family DNA binding protein